MARFPAFRDPFLRGAFSLSEFEQRKLLASMAGEDELAVVKRPTRQPHSRHDRDVTDLVQIFSRLWAKQRKAILACARGLLETQQGWERAGYSEKAASRQQARIRRQIYKNARINSPEKGGAR